jgi:hypothetical protein
MSRSIRKHANPASLIAMVALFVALGGVSYAAATIGSAQIKNNSVKSVDIKNGTIVTKDIKKSTRNALRGQQGPQGNVGAAGPAGPQGAQGIAGTALAYAQVNDSGPAFVSARTSDFDAVTRPAAGRYCLQPSAEVIAQAFSGGAPTRPTVATVEYGNTGTQTDTLIVQSRGTNALCPDNTFEVHTYRNGAVADDVAFSVIVP